MHDTLAPYKPGTNTHPVDQLGDLRALKKELTEIEEELKERVMAMADEAGRDSIGGDRFIARQTVRERKGGLDEKRLTQHLGKELVANYRKPSATYIVLSVEERVA